MAGVPKRLRLQLGAPKDQAERSAREQWMRGLPKYELHARHTADSCVEIVPAWVYKRRSAPRAFKVIATCSATEDPSRFIRELECGVDIACERKVDEWSERLRAAISPPTEGDVPSTWFSRAKRVLRSARADELPGVLADLVDDIRSAGLFERLLAVKVDATTALRLEAAVRQLMSLERWGWRATEKAVGAGSGPSAMGLTSSFYQLVTAFITFPLVASPFLRGIVFARDSIAIVGIFPRAHHFRELENWQESVDRMLHLEGSPMWSKATPREPADEPTAVEHYYRWYLERLNEVYATLWNCCNFAERERPLSEQFRTYSTVQSIAYDVSRVQSARDAYVQTRFCFGIVDKLANVISEDPRGEPGIVKELLAHEFFRTRVDAALAKIPTSIGSTVASGCGSAAYRATPALQSTRPGVQLWPDCRCPLRPTLLNAII
jgi:hypothetical protein